MNPRRFRHNRIVVDTFELLGTTKITKITDSATFIRHLFEHVTWNASNVKRKTFLIIPFSLMMQTAKLDYQLINLILI